MEDTYDAKPVFNMGLATLERINSLIIQLSQYNMDFNISGMKNSILELYKETYVFMNKTEKEDAEGLWQEIENCKLIPIGANQIKFDTDLVVLITDFDFWLRETMHKKGLLMPKADDPRKAMTKTKGY